jgi:uncharacterized protein (DUF302 family)
MSDTQNMLLSTGSSVRQVWSQGTEARQMDRSPSRSLILPVVVGLVCLIASVTVLPTSLKIEREQHRTMATNNGIINKQSSHSVQDTVTRLEGILKTKGITLFALIDHSGEAEKVGMAMRPTKLLIFGNPKAGTPLMTAAPTVAIDLPMKILVWEDAEDKVWISYNSTEYLQERHGLPTDLLKNMSVENLASAAAQ